MQKHYYSIRPGIKLSLALFSHSFILLILKCFRSFHRTPVFTDANIFICGALFLCSTSLLALFLILSLSLSYSRRFVSLCPVCYTHTNLHEQKNIVYSSPSVHRPSLLLLLLLLYIIKTISSLLLKFVCGCVQRLEQNKIPVFSKNCAHDKKRQQCTTMEPALKAPLITFYHSVVCDF